MGHDRLRRATPVILARGLALFLGTFLLACVVAAVSDGRTNASHWLLDVRAVPTPIALGWLGLTGAVLVGFGCFPRIVARRRRWFVIPCAVNALVALANTVTVLHLGASSTVTPAGLPFSALVAVAFVWIAVSRPDPAPHGRVLVPFAAGACAVLFALGQMACFGPSDYRRSADAIVVPGARVYADGRPSPALADRVRTACELYREGHAPLLIVSGGPGDGAVHETEAMRRMAIDAGVPADAIALDRAGVSSRATVRNVSAILARRGMGTTLVVSHAYHLPRLKMALEQEGVHAYTVPAEETVTMLKMPYFVARETAALWAYFLGLA